MARKYLASIDLTGNELLNARVQNLATPPAHAAGRFYYDTTLGQFGISNGTTWTYVTGALDSEAIQDLVGAQFTANGNSGVTSVYNDATGKVTLTVTDSPTVAGQTPANLRDRATHTGTQTADTITDGTTNKVFTAADESKLDGVASGATANSTDAQLRDRATHTGTQSADTVVDGTTNKAFTAGEKTKLAGVAPGATANAPDADLRDRNTHTGTQVAATISDFQTTVRTNKITDLAAPTTPLSLNGQKIVSIADAVADTDAPSWGQVKAVTTGVRYTSPVRAATTANITLTGTQTVDGIALVAGNRVLVKDQTNGAENGIYVVAAGAWTRATDADTPAELSAGLAAAVNEGTTNAGRAFVLTTSGSTVVGTTPLTFQQLPGSASVTYTGGAGLTLTDSVFAVGAGTGITVQADTVSVDTAVVVRKFSATIGDGAATSISVTHNLNTQDITYSIRETATNAFVDTDVVATGVNVATFTFASAPATNQYRVVIHG